MLPLADWVTTMTDDQTFTSRGANGGSETAVRLTARSGFSFYVRPASTSDQSALAGLVGHMSPDDLRFRFLTATMAVPPATLTRMTNVDHEHTEDFLAFDGSTLIASAMLAADKALARGEVAVAVHGDYKGRGVGWAMLEHAVDFARRKGVKLVESIESRDNHDVIALEREMGFSARPFPGDATLILLEMKLD